MSTIDWSQMITKEMKDAAALEAATKAAKMTQARLSSEASNTINAYNDMVDMGLASQEDEAKLAEWKAYRVSLLQVPKQPGYPLEISWPVKPE